MSKLKISAVGALVVAGVATPLFIQHQHAHRLRLENQRLQAQVQQAETLGQEKDKLSAQLMDARQSQALSQAQLSELMRLRGEVGPLRRDSQELARLRASQEAQRPAPGASERPAPPDFIPAAAWANVGADKPENAIQTFFWAGKHAETNLIGNLLRWQRDRDIPASDELDDTFANGLISGATHFAGSLQGFRVTSQREEGNDEVRLGIELTDREGKAQPHTLRLVREDNQWFPVMHVWLHDQGSVRAAMEIPPKFEQRR